MRAIRQVLGATVIDPALLTSAERIQYSGFQRRQDNSQTIKALAAAGRSIKEITRSTGRSRKLVRNVLRGGDGDVFRCRIRVLEPHTPMLRAEWEAGCRNGAELWRRLCDSGFRGGLRVVTEWATRQRRSETAGSMGRQPRLHCFGLSVWQQIDDPAPFQIAHHRSVSLPAPPGEVVDAEDADGPTRGLCPPPQHPQQRVSADRQHEASRQVRSGTATQCDPEMMNDTLEPFRPPGTPRRHAVRKRFAEYSPWAADVAASEPTDLNVQMHSTAMRGKIQ